MAMLLLHENAVFEDETVYATGNAFRGCAFLRCTIVLKGLPIMMERCSFASCVWHFDFILHDKAQTEEVMGFVTTLVMPSLPKEG